MLYAKNPNEKLRAKKIKGLNIFKGFTYSKSDKEWIDGTIYDSISGSIYKCIMWFESDQVVLNVKEYIGFSLIGKKVVWKSAK